MYLNNLLRAAWPAMLLAGCAASPAAAPVSPVELQRFMGRWYVIAAPANAESGRVGVYIDYRATDDGRVDETCYSRDSSFEHEVAPREHTAWTIDPVSNAHWRGQSFWPFTTTRVILHVSDDYRHALQASGSDVWMILAREPQIPEWIYAGLLARLAARNYDVSRLRKVPQTPEQLGQPGFE